MSCSWVQAWGSRSSPGISTQKDHSREQQPVPVAGRRACRHSALTCSILQLHLLSAGICLLRSRGWSHWPNSLAEQLSKLHILVMKQIIVFGYSQNGLTSLSIAFSQTQGA